MEMQMHKFRFWLIARCGLSFCLLALVAGCGLGSNSMTLMSIAPTSATIDAGQALPVLVGVVNDNTQRSGATYTITGGGTISAPIVTPISSSEHVNFNYTAPAAAGSATLTATSVNTPSQTATLSITINSALVITTATLPGGTVFSPYSATLASTGGTFTGNGGTAALKWTVPANTLPTGLTLDSSGLLHGTPTVFGTFPVAISVTDTSAVPAVVTQNYTIVIQPLTPTITTASLTNAIAGSLYSNQLAFTGGNGTTPTWTITAGSLPVSSGLTLQLLRSDLRHAAAYQRQHHLHLHRHRGRRPADLRAGPVHAHRAGSARGLQHHPAIRQHRHTLQ